MTQMDAWILERDAQAISRHIRNIRERVMILKSRPHWQTMAQADIQKAKDELTDLLEHLAECQRIHDAVPTVDRMESVA